MVTVTGQRIDGAIASLSRRTCDERTQLTAQCLLYHQDLAPFGWLTYAKRKEKKKAL